MTAGKPNNPARQILRGLGIALFHTGLASVVINARAKRVRALLYHAVESRPNDYTDGLNVSVTTEMFAANLDYFKRYYNVVSMKDVASGSLPGRPLVITFDDGYKSVYEHAMPALVSRNMSACIYLITRAVEGKIVWVNLLNYALLKHKQSTLEKLTAFDKLAARTENAEIISIVQHSFTPNEIEALCESLADILPENAAKDLYASESDILDMQANGLEFGFHTRDHYNLRNCSANELNEQLDATGCQQVLNSTTFAYPFGYFNQRAVACLESSAYERVMTVGNNNDIYSYKHLDRTEVFSASHAELFAQIEIVEPTIAWLRRWVLKRGTAKTDGVVQQDELAEASKNHAK
jgi:peptidoglycan/xylan/chitin deacetylase (PgdA/CDA1 family)